jgi:predicted Na+-dependent transporter
MADAAHPAIRARTRAASWILIPVALTVVSVVGLVLLLILDAADYGESGAWDDVSWLMFSWGGIIAFLTGAAAYVVGRRRRDDQARRMGMVGVGWFALAVLIVVIVEAVT